jgi:hypothetical protein
MLMLLLIVQFAVWAHTVHVAQAAAAEALAAARAEGGSAAAGQAHADQVRAQIGRRLLAGATITVTRGDDTARVEISGAAPRVVPLPFLNLPVHVTVSGPVERFRPDTEPQE